MVVQSPAQTLVNTEWKILVIDDDEEDFLIARDMLKEARGQKFQTYWANTYAAGRAELFSNHYNAVLVDYDLGIHSGIELIREASERGCASPLILFTGRGSYDVDVEAMGAGATMYLTKGEVNPLLLERAIRYAVELKHKEQALRLSEERFSKAFDANPNAQVVSRLSDGRIESINEGFQQLFGYQREEVLGKTSLELHMFAFPEDREEATRQIRTNRRLRDFELGIRTKSGEIRQASLSVEIISTEDETLMLTVIQDITERKKTEAALQQSEARLREFLDNIRDSFFILDRNWRFVYANHRLIELYGGDPEALLGKSFWDVMPRYRGSEHEPCFRQAMAERVQVNFEMGGLYAPAWLDVSIYPTGDGIAVLAVNRTEEKIAQAALQESEKHFRQLADAMPQLVWTARADGTVEYYNQRFREYDGIAPAEGDQWEWGPVLHSDDLQPTLDAWNRAVETGEVYQIEHRVRMADGSFCWHLSRGIPIKDEEGNVIRWYGTATNIHAQKESEERLRRSNQELEQFAFIASHDLQEPLRKIILFGNNLRSQLQGALNETVDETLIRMQGAAKRMQNMIKGLLDLSRVNSQGGNFMPIDLNHTVANVVADLEGRIQAAHGQVQIHDLPPVEADELQMRQLFLNLIGNAIKFHQPDLPPLVQVFGRIDAAREPHSVEIQVVDNGIGFDQESAERIFQPFHRLHGKGVYEGTGLGLAICKKIVERHHGSIEAQSVPGKGATFTIRLPARPRSPD